MDALTRWFEEANEGVESVIRTSYRPTDFSTIKIPSSPTARPHDIDFIFSDAGGFTLPGLFERHGNFIAIDVKHGERMNGGTERSLRQLAQDEKFLCLECKCYPVITAQGYWLFKPNTVTVVMPNAADDYNFFCEIDAFNDRIARYYNQPSLGRDGFTNAI